MHKTHIESGALWRNGSWRRGVAAAVALAIAGVTPLAHAQSTTVGNVFGHVEANSGDTVIVKNTGTGIERSVQVGGDGRFLTSSLPPGHYVVTLTKANAKVSSVELEVLAGRGSEAVFDTELEEVVVSATALSIDVSTTNNGTVFTASQLADIPIANHDLNGIMNIAANTVQADSRYNGGISIGGGGPSENAYYINGFAVTNPLTQLGSMELPYGAIQQAQIQTGGFGAEFGRSVGGVVNIITKTGGAEWHGGASIAYEPDGLRTSEHDMYYANVGTSSDGTLYRYNKDNSTDVVTYSANLGGPVIADKLFVFGAIEQKHIDDQGVNAARGSAAAVTTGWKDSSQNNLRYLGKIDWYITENNRLEATLLGDNYKSTDKLYGYNYTTLQPSAYSYTEKSKNLAGKTPGVGGDAQMLKYVGNLFDNLTVTALYGQSTYNHEDTFNPINASAPELIYSTTTTNRLIDSRLIDSSTIVPANALPGNTTSIAPGAHEDTKSFRFDLEYALGKHLLRAGLDINKLKSVGAGEIVVGPQAADSIVAPGLAAGYFTYRSSNVAGVGNNPKLYGVTGTQTLTLNQAGATPDANGYYYYVSIREFGDITDAESNQAAQYIEDRWQATDNLLVTLGLRNESFYNKNGDGQKFLKMDSFLAPRFATSWDVNGDASLKIFGSAGRYSLQVPTHIAVRGASRSALLDRYYTYTGVDATTGAPTGLTPLGSWYSANNEYGQAKDPLSVSGSNMKPTYQDEMTLGTEAKVLPDFVGGAMLTYRKLKASMDDFCDYRVIDAYAAANNITLSNNPYPFSCATINVGADNTLSFVTANGSVAKFNLTAADIGLPKPKRTYTAIDLFMEHPLKDKWYGKLTYTWSKSKGNTEGQTKSDTAQTDVALTSTWDFKEIMEYSNGYLPNDRRHQIKAFGYYQLTSEFLVGSTLVAESGRAKNCLGLYGGTGEDIYGGYNQFFYCDGVPTPRGSQGRLPWNYRLDLSFAYKPAFVEGLSVSADVLNVFNTQKVLATDDLHEDTGGLLPTYNRALAYSKPRSVRLMLEYQF